MKWEKMGLIFNDIPGQNWWQSHTLAPTPLVLANGLIRVFTGARDAQGISRITFVDLDPDRGLKPIYRHNAPVLNIGRPGTFDDNGVMPASVLRKDRHLYFYYAGFQRVTKVKYFMFGGAAVSDLRVLPLRRVSGRHHHCRP